MRKLSELEGVCLGVIYKRRSCTAYTVRMELKESPSSHWRASAGAIYPLLARLEDEGLIRSAEDAQDGRGRKLLTVTPDGVRAIKAWMKMIVDLDLISEISDPVRTRIFFLKALTNAEQIRLVEGLLKALKQQLSAMRKNLEGRPAEADLFDNLGAIGAIISTQGRIEFLNVVLSRIG